MTSKIRCERKVCKHYRAGSCALAEVTIDAGGGCAYFDPLRRCKDCARFSSAGCPIQSFTEGRDPACVELFQAKDGETAPEWLLEASQEPDPLTEPAWWIPVDEGLPEVGYPVLLRVFGTTEGCYFVAAYEWGAWTGEAWELDAYPEAKELTVTHWLQLPEDKLEDDIVCQILGGEEEGEA